MLLDLPTAALYPDGFMLSDDFVDTMKAWAADFGAPVRAGVEVTAISQSGLDFLVTADGRDMTAKAVVVATATYQHPRIPPIAGSIPPFIVQLHAEEYKNPAMVPDGAVIGLGSGQTGCQLVDDLKRRGREVYLCVGRSGRLPGRYRGKYCLEWKRDMKLLDRTPDMLDSPAQRLAGDPHLSGRDGGQTLSLHDFHARGVHLLGRLEAIDGGKLRLGNNLAADMGYAECAPALRGLEEYNTGPSPRYGRPLQRQTGGAASGRRRPRRSSHGMFAHRIYFGSLGFFSRNRYRECH